MRKRRRGDEEEEEEEEEEGSPARQAREEVEAQLGPVVQHLKAGGGMMRLAGMR